MNEKTTDGLLSLEEVARILGVSSSSLRSWRAAGVGPASFKVGKQVRFRPAAVSEYIERQEAANAGNHS